MTTPIILGIRRKIKADMNARRTIIFTKHLLQFLQIFAFLGVIFAMLIAADYFAPRNIQSKTITEKKEQRWTNGQIDYYLYAGDSHFTVNQLAYEHLPKGSAINLNYTLIFNTLTEISGADGVDTYISHPFNIYGWTFGIVIVSFLLSGFLLLKNTPSSGVNRDLLVSVGTFNLFTCLFMFAFLFLPAT
ncbi:MAG: hypothetical protein LBN37_07430 [Bacteroidales bacterium]|jgi:hypothetical protein|nr:hypothetical protein [Bacteroidales bacterium]